MRLRNTRRLLRASARRAGRLWIFMRMDRARGVGFRAAMLRRGFFSARAGFYPFEQFDSRWFVTDWAAENNFSAINPGEVSVQFGNKLFLHLLLRELGYGALTAPLVGAVVQGRFSPLSEFASVDAAMDVFGAVIVKPIDGFGGKGVKRLVAGAPVPVDGVYLVEGALRSHPYSARIFPGSLNTVRLMVLRLDAEEPFIVGAVHRFGVARSAPVDNYSRGGISVHVDPATGALGHGRSNRGFHASTHHAAHPDTGVAFTGTVIPHWDEIRALVLELTRRVPGVQIVGWDICVTPDGPRIIEGNGSMPGPDVLQVHRPLLLEPAARRFFLAKRIISRRQFEELERLAARSAPATDPAALAPG